MYNPHKEDVVETNEVERILADQYMEKRRGRLVYTVVDEFLKEHGIEKFNECVSEYGRIHNIDPSYISILSSFALSDMNGPTATGIMELWKYLREYLDTHKKERDDDFAVLGISYFKKWCEERGSVGIQKSTVFLKLVIDGAKEFDKPKKYSVDKVDSAQIFEIFRGEERIAVFFDEELSKKVFNYLRASDLIEGLPIIHVTNPNYIEC